MKTEFRRAAILACALIGVTAGRAVATPMTPLDLDNRLPVIAVQTARSCKQVRSCREAVELWCAGYARADADNDGIPCENICRSKNEVDAIRGDIGC
jgi:hypothetical protein